MAFDPVTAIFGVAEKVLERVWPDPALKAEALQKMAELKQSGELAFLNADLALMTGQIETNKLEVQHGGMFKGGWRPFIGWVCGLAFAYKFLVQPFIVLTVQGIAHFTGAEPFPLDLLPVLDWSELSVVLMGMLGLGTMRSYEKRKSAEPITWK
ncbi:MAG: holin family protein [Nitrospira sp.]|nr:holin family protein [Nitrospira sp.]